MLHSFPTRRSSDLLRLGYERAAACPADDDTRRLQLAKRPVCRHARDVELLDEIRFRRHTIAWLQAAVANGVVDDLFDCRSEEHTSELPSLMRISNAGFCLKTKKKTLT